MNILKTVCPKCKGNKYFKGQNYIPNYTFNKRGICFTCNGTGEAYIVNGEYIAYHHKAGWSKCDDKGKFISRCTDPTKMDDNISTQELEYCENINLGYEYKKEDILEVEDKYSEILNDIKNQIPMNYILDKVYDLYNFEEAARGLTDWKSDKRLVKEYLEKLRKNFTQATLQLGVGYINKLSDEHIERLRMIANDTSKKIVSLVEEGLV